MVIELRVVQFWSEIILAISNQNRAVRSFDFEITRMISDQIALHSVQLPLSINSYHTVAWSLKREENRSTGVPVEKLVRAEQRTNKLNPHVMPILGIYPGSHWCEASAHSTAPTLLPVSVFSIY